MSHNKSSFYITTAIHYANGLPHLGHAYENILTDVIARFHRLDGRDVHFLTGTDEYGEKIYKTAQDRGVEVSEFVKGNRQAFKGLAKDINMSADDFISTTEPRHHEAASAIWQVLYERGDIYKGKYEGWYSIREEGFFSDDEVSKGEDGVMRSPNGTEVVWEEEESYFFKLSAYADKLLAHYEAHPEFIMPASRRNEIISFVKGGLKDLSVSRHIDRLSWGIPVPGDSTHVMYVWLDALTNYITALGYPDQGADLYKTFWPADVHVIGKDIIRFHCVYWPAFLMAAELALPKSVFAHGFINLDGQKMSKSLGNVIAPEALIEQFGLDGFRYYLMREISHGQDGNFSQSGAAMRINADLSNSLGNLVQRSLSMIYKNCDGAIPQPGDLSDEDQALLNNLRGSLLSEVRRHMAVFEVHKALEVIWKLVSEANIYVDHQAPWGLKKTDPERMKTVLYVLAEVIRGLGIAVQFVIPEKGGAILDALAVDKDARDFSFITEGAALKPGTAIPQPEPIFPRFEIEGQETSAA